MTDTNSVADLTERVLDFAKRRNWSQFHDPKNLVMALASEVGELSALLRWVPGDQSDRAAKKELHPQLRREIGDVGIVLLGLCDRVGVDFGKAVLEKLRANESSYPAELTRGKADRPSKRSEVREAESKRRPATAPREPVPPGVVLSQLAARLLAKRDGTEKFWRWVAPGRSWTKKDANKFLLGCILDYQMQAHVVWENARRLAEDILGDPDDLWGAITECSLSEWNRRRSEYGLHRFPKGHERVYRIGRRIVSRYGGDARKIWRKQTIEGTLHRLNELGVGKQISNMVAGALVDIGHLNGKGDVKADVHVCRVLGRLVNGVPFKQDDAEKVADLTRAMHPANPWLLDRPLYQLGKSLCVASRPRCESCFMREACAFAAGSH